MVKQENISPEVAIICKLWNDKRIDYAEASRRMAAVGFSVVSESDLNESCSTGIDATSLQQQNAIVAPSSLTVLPSSQQSPVSIIPPAFPPVDYPTAPQQITTIIPTVPIGLKPYHEWPEAADYKVFLDHIESLITSIGESIKSQINEKLVPVEEPIRKIQALQVGGIQRKLDACGIKLAKAQDKILKLINQKMSECHGYLMSCGICYPTQEQVMYGLQTGNYMESVGINLPVTSNNQIDNSRRIVNEQQREQERILYGLPKNETTNQNTENITNNNYGVISNGQVEEKQVPIGTIGTIGATNAETNRDRETATQNSSSATSEKSTIEFYPLLGGEIPQAIKPGEPIAAPERIDLPPGPEKIGAFRSPNWDFSNVCEAIGVSKFEGDATKVLGFYRKDDGGLTAPQWWIDAWGIPPNGSTAGFGPIKRRVHLWLWEIISGVNVAAGEIFERLKKVFNCTDLPADALLIKAFTGFINHWTNDAFSGLLKGFDYEVNQACPQEIPSQPDIDDMFLADELSLEQWECYTKANNNLPHLATKNLARKRERVNFSDALMMYRLEKISVETFTKIARQNGYISTEDINNKIATEIDIPTVSDLIRMMVRDVGDPEIIKAYGLDDQFAEKWSGELERFANAQGMTEEIAKLHWRAHWDHPSATQAFEMLHRLRPDSVWAKKLDAELKAEAAIKGTRSAGVLTTAADVQRLLEVNDLSWYWRERLGAISYNPLTRTDVFRAFMIDAIEEDELKSAYQDAGYTAFDADTLVQFAVQQKKERETRKVGSRSVSKWVKWFQTGIISMKELEAAVNERVPNSQKRKAILDDAEQEYAMMVRESNVKCIQYNYQHGTSDDMEAKALLVREGILLFDANRMIDQWHCKRKKAKKEATAAKLCEWRERNLITPDQQLKRLVNLGYTLTDAEIIVKDCGISANEKTRQQIVRQIKAAEQQATKIAAQQEKAAKKIAAAERKAGGAKVE